MKTVKNSTTTNAVAKEYANALKSPMVGVVYLATEPGFDNDSNAFVMSYQKSKYLYPNLILANYY